MSAPPPVLDRAEVVRRLDRVRHRIAEAGGDPTTVSVVAVTKTFGPEVVRVALASGLDQLGESYAQELASKAADLDARPLPPAGGVVGAPAWHFIGGLQRNKVRRVAGLVSLWQSVDRAEVGLEIARRRPGAAVLVQVNTTGEGTKAGCAPGDASALVDQLGSAGLVVRGLMTVGPTDPTVDPRPSFAALRSLVDQLGLEVCSMGMSADLDSAIREGSTMVRLGTALFGPRAVRGAGDSSVA